MHLHTHKHTYISTYCASSTSIIPFILINTYHDALLQSAIHLTLVIDDDTIVIHAKMDTPQSCVEFSDNSSYFSTCNFDLEGH